MEEKSRFEELALFMKILVFFKFLPITKRKMWQRCVLTRLLEQVREKIPLMIMCSSYVWSIIADAKKKIKNSQLCFLNFLLGQKIALLTQVENIYISIIPP